MIALLEIPLVLASKMEKLKIPALFGVICIVIFLGIFLVFFGMATSEDSSSRPVGNMRMFPDNWLLAAATVPNIFLALSFQMNFFPIYKGMREATDKKMKMATFLEMRVTEKVGL